VASYVAKLEPIETNIVIFELASHVEADKFIRDLEAKDILISDMGGGKLRMVTHLDYSSKMHKKLLEVLETVS
jgi:threonine aldolase